MQDADGLIQDVMRRRGYPVDDFDTRAADLSVDHPDVVENYRAGHGIAVARERGKAGTDELRRAIQHYRVAVRRARRRDRARGGAVVTEERIQTGDLVTDDADAPIARDEPAGTSRAGSGWSRSSTQAASRSSASGGTALQARFVDEPRDTVSEADSLVAELLRDLAQSFDDARSKLEEQWSSGEDVSTEDLRVTLQRYRSFFERLLEA